MNHSDIGKRVKERNTFHREYSNLKALVEERGRRKSQRASKKRHPERELVRRRNVQQGIEYKLGTKKQERTS